MPERVPSSRPRSGEVVRPLLDCVGWGRRRQLLESVINRGLQIYCSLRVSPLLSANRYDVAETGERRGLGAHRR